VNARLITAMVLLAGLSLRPSAARPGRQTPQGQAEQARPTFRSVSDAVPVHVTVQTGRSFVGGLTTADFELIDNGVPQQITSVTPEVLPVDVTLVVDSSGSVIRSLNRFKSDVRKIAEALGDKDAVRLLTFDTGVTEPFAMQLASERVPVDAIRTGDLTSLNDAVLLALARALRVDRRHLIFVFTDGYDNASMTGYEALPLVASRTDAVLHIVLVKVTGVPDEGAPAARQALQLTADRTGGVLYPPDDDDRDVVQAFKRTLEAFRHGYVIYFTPRNVERVGWHQLVVRVTRPGSYEIRARQRYFGG
jgi:VWFA-related protein